MRLQLPELTWIHRATDLAKEKQPTRTNDVEYGLTEIGDYCWFRQNLEATVYANGEDIPLLTGNSAWNNAGLTGMSAYRLYGDDAFYAEDYGLHYNGWAARDDRGLCPSGFAIPVNANFENLLASATENQLVSAAGWDNESWNGNNESGFSLIPAGYISSSGSSGGSQSYLWSQSVRDIYYPANWNFLRSGDNEPYLQSDLTMGKGLSVRCVSVVSGCMDADACNYDENANADSGACDYSCQEFVDPSGEGPCQGQTSVIYQGHTYPVVEVENQCWFAENLQSTAYANGDAIVAPADADDWSDYAQSSTGTVTTGYSYDSDFWLATYGRLYSGHAVLDARNLCPSGWAVPTSQDFTNLINTGLNGELRSTTGWTMKVTMARTPPVSICVRVVYRYRNGVKVGISTFWSSYKLR